MRKTKKILAIGLAVNMLCSPAYNLAPIMTVQAATQNGFVTKNEKTYYYKDGTKLKGEQKIGKYWYLFDGKGVMLTGIQYISDKKIYCLYNKKGRRVYGAQKYDGHYYYFDDETGAMLRNTFKYIPRLDATYYYDKSGILQYGPTLKVNGETYKLDPATGKVLSGNLRYKVTFVDGVTKSVIKTQNVKFNKNAKAPSVPTHAGYTFSKWDKSLKKINADTTITALYNVNSYTVTFKDGVDNKVIKTETVQYGKSATQPSVPTHEGYTFSGWDKSSTNISVNITITAKYAKNKYTIKFVDGVDKSVVSTQTVEYGESASAPSPKAHSGYKFVKWDASYSGVKASATITSVYEKQKYTVKFVDGVDNSVISEQTVEYGAGANVSAPKSHSGYVFSKWDKPYSNITGDLTVTALYEKQDYTVTFKDGVDNSVLATQKIEYGKAASAPTVKSHPGYKFVRWNKAYKNITENVTITAVYEYENGFIKSNGKTYYFMNGKAATGEQKIDGNWYLFDSNGVMLTGLQKIPGKSVYSLYNEDGVRQYGAKKYNGNYYYFDDETGAMLVSTFKYIPRLDATYYYNENGILQYGPTLKVNGKTYQLDPATGKLLSGDLTYKVTYIDGISGQVISTQNVTFGKDGKYPNAPEHEGYTFSGWDASNSKVHSDLTIAANYKKSIYTVTFIDGVDGKQISSQQITHGENAAVPTPAVHNGYTFDEWSASAENIKSAATITAVYRKNKYTVTFKDGIDNSVVSTQSVEYESGATAPTPKSHSGYEFSKWDKAFNKITKDTVVTAIYEEAQVSYTVKFVDGFDKSVIDTQQVVSGGNADAPKTKEHPGYAFSKWDKSLNSINSDTTITAQYAVKDDFYTVSGKKYYYKSGKAVTGQQTIGGSQYYFGTDGVMQTGFITVGDNTYLYGTDGKMLFGRQMIPSKNRYGYFNPDTGVLTKSQFINIDGKRYWYTKNGYEWNTPGLRTIGGEYYYFNKDDSVATGTVKTEDSTCVFDKTGKMTSRILDITYISQTKGVWNGKKWTETAYTADSYKSFIGRTFKYTACGITSCAMALRALTGKPVLPSEFNAAKYGFNGIGSNQDVALKTSAKYNGTYKVNGVSYKIKSKLVSIKSETDMINQLKQGHFVVIAVNRGTIYGGGGAQNGSDNGTGGGGHFILIHGYKNGKFAVADPNNLSQSYTVSYKVSGAPVNNLKKYSTFGSHFMFSTQGAIWREQV